MKTVFLEFAKPFGPYSTGDSAGFAEDAAARYLELGVAKRTGEKDGGAKPVAAATDAAAAEAQATPETAEPPAADKPKAPKGKTAKQ